MSALNLSASTLVGNTVRNPRGEKLGKLEEIMLDCTTGHVAYAVLSFGGFLGIGDKLFAIPWRKLELDTVEKEFVLDIDKKTLEKAPGFDKERWPEWDLAYADEVYAYHGVEPYWK